MSVGRRLKLELKNVRVRVAGKYATEGSVLRGDRKAVADGYTVEVSLDSDEPAERIAQLIKEAEASCFTIAALRNPTPVDLAASLNGEQLALEA